MEASKALQSLKVPELKARCKELKIPNFSRLSKADLITKILEATTGKSTDITTHSPTQVESQITTTNDVSASKKSGESGGALEKKKEGNVKKRKATDQAGPSSKSFPTATAKEVEEVVVATESTQSQESQSDPNPTSLPGAPAIPADTPTSTKIKAKTVKSKDTAPKPKAGKKAAVPIAEIGITTSKPKSKSKTQAAPKKSILEPLLAVTSQATTQASETTPQIFWKTPTAGAVKSKARPSRLTVDPARPRFTGLIPSKPISVPSPAPPTQDVEIDLSTVAARIKFIETHFLNTLFTLLHQYRAKPITAPYPCPVSFTKSPNHKQTIHLAFQGFHPDVYETRDGFQVAIRFWIARLHSYMALGSGEAWSGRAGGMGMSGPDLATWPAILGVERVTDGIWAIRTGEDTEEVRYLIMGENGEVVASSKGITGEEVLVSGCVVRSDWAKYLGSRDRKSLGSMVKTKESYHFPNGVAKGWAEKQSERMVKIANRAVLASCALNSFSGEKMSSTVMDAAHIGRSAQGVASNDLDFYLPENSQILSVHRPPNLHPDLAIVHRGSGFSEFVLVETGQMVGLEDEGVVSLWQGLLGCNAKGEADESGQREFWTGWESRMKFSQLV